MRSAVLLFLLVIIGAAVVFAVLGFIRRGEKERTSVQKSMSSVVTLRTKDGFTVVGDYYSSRGPNGVLLLHMMPSDRKSWVEFATRFQAAGFQVLAIDLRGHGESQGGPDGYKKFSDAEHQASKLDVEAGVEFLKSKGAENVYQGGASIGANLALQYLAEHPQTKAAFLLSPGLDYRGITTEPAARSLKSGQAVYYVASRDDVYSAETVQKLYDVTPTDVQKEIKLFENSGHGTAILEKNPEFMETLIKWLTKF